MANKQIAINSNSINRLIIDTNDYAIRLKKIFNEIEAIVDNISTYYDCSSMKYYQKSFNQFRKNFQTMSDNMLTYKADMKTLNKVFVNKEIALSQEIMDESRKIQSRNIK